MNQSKDHIPFVTVCLMTYNRAHYLRGVIDSWLAQTYKDFEIVLANDASTDGTDAICKEYAAREPRIRYFRQEKNLGNPACYKFTLNKARGTYFVWASDDDIWDERFLEDCIAMYQKHPELIMVFAGMVDIDRSRNVVKQLNPDEYLPDSPDLYERLKQYILFYFEDGKNQILYGLWKRESVSHDDPMFGYRAKDDHPPFYWGFTNFYIFKSLVKGPVGFVDQLRFFRRSRVSEERREERSFLPRMALTFYHRLEKIFGIPFFWYQFRFIWSVRELSIWEKLKLTFWQVFVIGRLFFVRKM